MNIFNLAFKYKVYFFIIVLISFNSANAKTTDTTAVDFMHVPGPIIFNGNSYNLIWSSKPIDNYYKQEYLPAGDSLSRFKKLFLVDVLIDKKATYKDLALLKVNSLKERKKYDIVADFHLIQSPDSTEFILDFITSQGRPKLEFVEWNAYKYKEYKDAKGNKGVLLYGISLRSYGDEAAEFVGNLPATRETVIQQLMKYNVPPVSIK